MPLRALRFMKDILGGTKSPEYGDCKNKIEFTLWIRFSILFFFIILLNNNYLFIIYLVIYKYTYYCLIII